MRLGFILMFLSVAAFAAEDKVFEIKQYPKDFGDCHQVAKEIGVHFQEVTGLEVIESLCTLIGKTGNTIRVTYRAHAVVPHVSTNSLDSSLDERGGFKTEADCKAALGAEVEHFARATGLTPVVNYCSFEEYDRDYPWAVQMDAFGEAKQSPRHAGAYIFGSVLGYSQKSFTEMITANLLSQGVDARWARFRSSVGYGRLTVFYYAPSRVTLDDVTVTKVTEKEKCLGSIQELEAILSKYQPLPVVSFCAAESVGGYYELISIFPFNRSLKFSPSAELYATYDKCQADRGRLVQYYQTELKRPVVGGFCGLGSSERGAWRITLLEAK